MNEELKELLQSISDLMGSVSRRIGLLSRQEAYDEEEMDSLVKASLRLSWLMTHAQSIAGLIVENRI